MNTTDALATILGGIMGLMVLAPSFVLLYVLLIKPRKHDDE